MSKDMNQISKPESVVFSAILCVTFLKKINTITLKNWF